MRALAGFLRRMRERAGKVLDERRRRRERAAVRSAARRYVMTHGLNFSRDLEIVDRRLDEHYETLVRITAMQPERRGVSRSEDLNEVIVAFVDHLYRSLSEFQKEVIYLYVNGSDGLLEYVARRIHDRLVILEGVRNKAVIDPAGRPARIVRDPMRDSAPEEG